MTTSTSQPAAALAAEEMLREGFDQPHLARYTLADSALEREIVGLFLQQLPQIVASLQGASTQAEWKMAAHTLKGSAAAVGASAIHAAAVKLEHLNIAVDVNVRSSLLGDLEGDVARFQRIVATFYGPF